jgi:hypothetical protein
LGLRTATPSVMRNTQASLPWKQALTLVACMSPDSSVNTKNAGFSIFEKNSFFFGFTFNFFKKKKNIFFILDFF